jgi:16S rRNA (guanine966-N2)-methyltransferase
MAIRIISGDYKGRKLRSVRGMKTRPTADRIREAIFNILAFQIRGAIVLDLFAGTGAFGIEALSRGAKSVVFVDVDRDSISVLRENIRRFSLESPTKIFRWDITRNLNCLSPMRATFNLVFMDPPYNKDMVETTLLNLHRSQSMQKDARIIVEHSFLEPVSKCGLPFEISDQRGYGKTLVSFLNYVV